MFSKLEHIITAQGKTSVWLTATSQHNLHSKPTMLCHEILLLEFNYEWSFFMFYVAVGIAIHVRKSWCHFSFLNKPVHHYSYLLALQEILGARLSRLKDIVLAHNSLLGLFIHITEVKGCSILDCKLLLIKCNNELLQPLVLEFIECCHPIHIWECCAGKLNCDYLLRTFSNFLQLFSCLFIFLLSKTLPCTALHWEWW